MEKKINLIIKLVIQWKKKKKKKNMSMIDRMKMKNYN
jgi:hypothetical protein